MRLFLTIVLLLLTLACDNTKRPKPAACPFLEKDSNNQFKIIEKYRFIAHAGGQIAGFNYTNSKEAIVSSISNGFKLIEIDLIDPRSKKKNLYGAHDWSFWKKATNNKTLKRSNFSDKIFKASRIYGQFTPVDFNQLNSLFKENKYLYLVTDKTKNFEFLVSNFYSQEKLIVEVFSKADYVKALQIGIKYPMLAIKESIDLLDFIQKNKISMATISYKGFQKYKKRIKALPTSTCFYIYGLNDDKKVKSILQEFPNLGFYLDQPYSVMSAELN